MNEYYRKKYWEIQTSNHMDMIDDEDIMNDIKSVENDSNYQQKDDEMLDYLEMIDP